MYLTSLCLKESIFYEPIDWDYQNQHVLYIWVKSSYLCFIFFKQDPFVDVSFSGIDVRFFYSNRFCLFFSLFKATAAAYTQTPQPLAPHPQQAPQPQVNLQAVNQAPPGAQSRNIHSVQTQEMNIPNDLIGCIIGRGGQKISEIR